MMYRSRLALACSLLACLILTATSAFGQTSFRYGVPQFSRVPGSELVLSNLGIEAAQAEVRFIGANGVTLSSFTVSVPAGNQARLNATSFTGTEGTAVVLSSKPLSVMATIANPNGAIENVPATTDVVNSIIPFYSGFSTRMDLTLSNANSLPTTALIRAFASDGTALGTAERPIPPSGSITEAVSSLFPQFTSATARQISHIGILAEANVLTEERRLHVQARIGDYPDPAILAAATFSSAAVNPVLPYFVEGGDFATTIQVVNPSSTPASVSIIPYDARGRMLSIGTSVQLPPNGSVRNTVQNMLNTGTGVVTGSIVFTSNVPILVTEAIANKASNAFVVTSAVSAETNVAFSQRKGPSRSYIGLTILNQNPTSAHVRLRSIYDGGVATAQVSLVVEPNSSLTRSFDELLSDEQIDGFVHISSDVPVFVSALEASSDNTLLANLPAIRAPQEYNAPTSSLFRIKGTVRRIGGTVAGVRVQLSGALNVSLVTDTSGAFVQRVLPGQYTLEPSDPSYVFNPPIRTVTITQDDSVGNDFEASLTGPTPKPTLLSISPTTTELRLGLNITPLFLTATGANFVPGAKIFLNNVGIDTQFVSSTTLSASVPASLLAVGGAIQVSVQNPAPSLGVSETLSLSIVNPAPALVSIDPPAVTISPSAPISINLLGENFAPTSVFELTPPCASIFATKRIDAQNGILTSNLQCAGTYYVRVRTPEPGGGTSQTLSLTVN